MQDLGSFEGKTFLITGATGLIAQCLIKSLLNAYDFNINVIAFVRDVNKARRIFKNYLDNKRFFFIVGDVCHIPIIEQKIDYIIHAAGQTSSNAFIEQPVETSLTALNGTINFLQLAREKQVKGFIYLSTMEVYGAPSGDDKITESYAAELDTMQVRSCYPESKRMCENLCASYASEYGIPAMVMRLAQTFGPGVKYDDSRVFAEFSRCVIENRDIIIHSKGDTKRCYLYTDDAISAILCILLKGIPGEAYNVANEDTYCTIYEMAQMVAGRIANHNISVIIENSTNLSGFGYAPTLHMNLDVSKLKALGWSAQIGLEDMFRKTINAMQEYRFDNDALYY